MQDNLAKQNDDEDIKPSLSDAMNAISERRLQFTKYVSTYVTTDSLGQMDEALAAAYLSGIDDANRIIQWLNGEGDSKNLPWPQFFKAKIHKPSEYGIGNLPAEERMRLLPGDEEPLDK